MYASSPAEDTWRGYVKAQSRQRSATLLLLDIANRLRNANG